MIPYGHQSINKNDIKAVAAVLKSDWLTQGPAVERFEKELAGYSGAKYAAVFSSGTAALHAAYFAAGLGKDDEFITTPLTFVATANAGLYLGAKPTFSDIDEIGNLEVAAVAAKITSRTKMIVPVDYAGQPAAIDKFMALAKWHNLVIVEDACHALGAELKGRKIGSWAHMTVFSFHPVKPITTGEGGAVLTDNSVYFEKLKIFRMHGVTKNVARFERSSPGDWYYEMQDLGFNYRLTDIQAALGLSQLGRLDKFIARRRKIAARYDRELAGLTDVLELPKTLAGAQSSWHLYPIRLRGQLAKKRGEIFKNLRAAGIGVQVHYIPVYWQPFYQKLGYKKGLCPKAEAFYEAELSLPIYPDLSAKDQSLVIKMVKKYAEVKKS